MNQTRANLIRQLVSKRRPVEISQPCTTRRIARLAEGRWLVRFSAGRINADDLMPNKGHLYPVLTGVYLPAELIDDKDAYISICITHVTGGSVEAFLSPRADRADDICAVQAAINTADSYVRMDAFDCGLMVTRGVTVRLGVEIAKVRRLGSACFCEIVFIDEHWEKQSISLGAWRIKMDVDQLAAMTEPSNQCAADLLLSALDRHQRMNQRYNLGFSDPLEDHPIWDIGEELSIRDPDMQTDDICLLYA